MRVEAAALRPLPARRATDFTEIVARVTRTGGFMVHNIFYSAPTGAAPRRMDADAFRRAVVDRDEDCHPARIPGEGGGHVGSPHRVVRLRNDRAVMTARAAGRPDRVATAKPFARISRRTRRFEVRRPP